ncbi:MAG: diguanylate cyclase [Spongiibacteraceae bacterium]
MLKKLRLGFYIGIAILIVDALVPLMLAHRVGLLRADADAALATRDDLAELLSAYKDAETGQRGFMLTGRSAFLEPYHSGRATIDKLIPTLERKLRNNPQQINRLAALREADRKEHAFQQQRIEKRNETNWLDIEATEHGKLLMDHVRLIIADLSAAEIQRSDALLQRVNVLQRWSTASLIVITTFDLILFGILFAIMTRAIFAERAARNELINLNKNLADEITLRNETLSRLQEQSERFNQVLHIQTALAEAQLNIDAFMRDLVQRMLAIKPTTGAVIEMIEADNMVYVAASGSIAQFVGLRLARGGSLSGLCVEKNEVMISADTDTDPRVDKVACKKVGAATMIVAPLMRIGEPVGVIKIVADRPNAFDDNAVQTLQLMAGALGAALGNQVQFQKNQTLLSERNITLSTLKRELRRREEYERKLLNQQETLHAITNAIPAAVAFINPEGYLVYCNNEYARICGRPPEQIIGQSLKELLGESSYLEHKTNIDRAFAGQSVIFETSPHTPIGWRHHECHLIPQRDSNDQPDGFYSIAWDITERKSQEIEWQSRASIDELTGLLNRAFFTEALNHALQRHFRSSATIAVFYLDIDRFKHINDTYGHAAGDTVLKIFARHLKQSVRLSDVVGRLGGDEFCIVLEDIKSESNAITIAEKILTAARAPIIFENDTLNISTSIGIAFAPHPRIDSAQLIAYADAALYKAKQAGRNGYALEIVHPETVPSVSNR